MKKILIFVYFHFSLSLYDLRQQPTREEIISFNFLASVFFLMHLFIHRIRVVIQFSNLSAREAGDRVRVTALNVGAKLSRYLITGDRCTGRRRDI